MILVNEYLIKESKRLYNIILPFIQFYLGYNILFRFFYPTYEYLEKRKLNKYYKKFEEILKQIEDKYILEQKIFSLKEKLFVLSKKYHFDLSSNIQINKEKFIYSNYQLIDIKNYRSILVWRLLYSKGNILYLEGKDNCILKSSEYYYFCKIDNKIFFPKYYYYYGYDTITMYGNINKGRIIKFDIPLQKVENQIIQFFLSYKGYEIEIFPSLGWFCFIPSIFNGYYNSGIFVYKYIGNRLNIYLYNKTLRISFEDKYQKELKKLRKENIIKLRNNYYKNKIAMEQNKTIIWIINDRKEMAGDNGEYFFRFLKKKNPSGIKLYFVIKRESPDYKRLKPLENILAFDSEDYLNNFLLAKKIISSVFECWVDNPFGNERKYIKDLFNHDYIFIQHGIIKDDLSNYINRINKNYKMIVTSTDKEYQSLINHNYYYNIYNVILTGLPRYDNLKNKTNINDKGKIIAIIPSWRKFISEAYDSRTHESIYSQTFCLTNFFTFYNDLINEKNLIINMKKYNYSGIFCLHPNFSKQWIDFRQNEVFSVLNICNYQNI